MNRRTLTRGPISKNSPFAPNDTDHSEFEIRFDVARTLEAVNAILVALQVPPRLHTFMQAVITASEGNKEFQASDMKIASVVRDRKNKEANKKWAQRSRKSLTRWQETYQVTLIQIQPGYQKKKQYFRTKYKVPLLDLAAKLLKNPGRNMQETARTLSRALVSMPARIERARNRPRMDAEALLNRHRKTVLTFTRKMSELVYLAGANPVDFIRQINAEQIAIANDIFVKGTDPSPSSGSLEEVMRSFTDFVHSDTVNTKRTQAGGMDLALKRSELIHIDRNDSAQSGVRNSCAFEALELFQSVGATGFKVTMKNEDTGRAVLYQTFDIESFRVKLPGLLSRNSSGTESLIVRPSGSFVQIDDLTKDLTSAFETVAFLTIQTSPQSYQVWLAPIVRTQVELGHLRSRVLANLGTSADPGANGVLRWPGSLNCKRTHRTALGSFPMVTTISCTPSRQVTPNQLEALGLLSSDASRKDSIVRDHSRHGTRRHGWPDYQSVLNKTSVTQKGSRDRSVADFNWSVLSLRLGFSEHEVVAELRCVSEKAKSRDVSYAEATVRKAAVLVFGC